MNEIARKMLARLYDRAYSSGTDARMVLVPRGDLIAALDMLNAMDIVQTDAIALLQPHRVRRTRKGARNER